MALGCEDSNLYLYSTGDNYELVATAVKHKDPVRSDNNQNKRIWKYCCTVVRPPAVWNSFLGRVERDFASDPTPQFRGRLQLLLAAGIVLSTSHVTISLSFARRYGVL